VADRHADVARLSFLRGDVTPRPRRFREGEVRVHPNGAQSDGSVTLHVADLDASVARFRALLGPGAAIATRDAVGADIHVALASTVTTTLSTVSPGAKDADDAGRKLRRTLAGRSEGQSVCRPRVLSRSPCRKRVRIARRSNYDDRRWPVIDGPSPPRLGLARAATRLNGRFAVSLTFGGFCTIPLSVSD